MTDTETYYFTDTLAAELTYAGDDEIPLAEFTDGFDRTVVETVERDGPWTDFFDTSEFVQFEATVAQPITQPYEHGGELVFFQKDEASLKETQAQLQHTPWTIEHPPRDRVASADEIKGFWTDPRYEDGQHATLNIPVTDTDAIEFAVQTEGVSPGFRADVVWNDDSTVAYDGVQTNFVYDHVASVENPRCPPEAGCRLHTDSQNNSLVDRDVDIDADYHGHIVDDVRTQATDDTSTPAYDVGDWVQWEWSDGTATGKVTTVATSDPVSTSGTTRDPTEADEPAYKIKHWDSEHDEFGNLKVAYESNLSSASPPDEYTDDVPAGCAAFCSVGPCSCGGHDPFRDADVNGEDIDLTPPEAAQEAAQRVLDAREDDEKSVAGMTDHGWARAEQLASAEELSPSDIVGSSGAMAPWWSRHETYSIEGGDSLSLKRDGDTEDWWRDNSYVAGLGWGGVAGYRWAIRNGNQIKEARGESANYSLADDATTTPFADATTLADTITFEGTRTGKLDESAIPNDDYEDHYVFDADTKTESSYPLVDGDGYLRRGNVDSAFYERSHADDHELLLDVLAQATNQFDDPPIADDELASARDSDTTDSMTSIHEFIDENDLTREDVLDSLNVDVKEEPTDFYDDEPDPETLADDFGSVQVLLDSKKNLEQTNEQLRDSLRERRKEDVKEKVEELTDITDAWGDGDALMDEFEDADDPEAFVDDIESKIEAVRDAASSNTTTVEETDDADDTTDMDRDASGGFDLRQRTKTA